MTAYTVQIEKTLAERLERAAHTAKISRVELITECVAQHLDIAIRHRPFQFRIGQGFLIEPIIVEAFR